MSTQWNYVNQLVYNPTLTVVKLSILVFLRRLESRSRIVNGLIWGAMVFVTLLFVATGNKVASGIKGLPQVLQDVINTKLQAYKTAPKKRVQQGGGVSSWSFFARDDVQKPISQMKRSLCRNPLDRTRG